MNEHLVNKLISSAINSVSNNDFLPMLILFRNETILAMFPIVLIEGTDEEKMRLAMGIKQIMLQTGLEQHYTHVCFMLEARATVINPASNNPSKYDVLLFVVGSKDGDFKSAVINLETKEVHHNFDFEIRIGDRTFAKEEGLSSDPAPWIRYIVLPAEVRIISEPSDRVH